MQYMGSKSKIAKEILEIIKPDEYKNFYDLFCGGCNLIDKVSLNVNRYANDINSYLIALFIDLQNGYIPPDFVSKEEYTNVRLNKEKYKKSYVAFVGFLCSFGAKWFNGYAHNSKNENYALRGKNVLLKQIKKLKNVMFYNKDYSYFINLPKNSVIYCDIPYKNTTKYNSIFNYEKFYKYCILMSKKYKIYISEYTMPKIFKEVMSINKKCILNKNKQEFRIEKLFTI